MKLARMLAVAAAVALLAPRAFATDYNVDPSGGNDMRDGLTKANAWKNMSKANTTIVAGDRVFLWPGNHTGFPAPVNADGVGGFTFIGAGLTTDPIVDTLARATINVPCSTPPTSSLTKSNVYIKGVHITGTPQIAETADHDTLAYCTVDGSFMNQGGDYDIIDNCVFKGSRLVVNFSNASSQDLEIYNCQFRYLGQGYTGFDHAVVYFDCDSTVEMFNTYYVTGEAASSGDNAEGPNWHFDDRDHVSRGNHWYYHDMIPGSYATLRYRTNGGVDHGSHDNSFDRDTLIFTGLHGYVDPSSSADCGLGGYPECMGSWNFTIDSCLVDAGKCSVSRFFFQGGTAGLTMSRTTVVMNGPALETFSYQLPASSITYCTFAGQSFGGDWDHGDGVVQLNNQWGRPAMTTAARLTFKDNIVHCFTPANGYTQGVVWATDLVDSARVGHNQTGLVCHHNLYSVSDTTQTISLNYAMLTGNHFYNIPSTPGDSVSGTPTRKAENRLGIDSTSALGDPQFNRGAGNVTRNNFNARVGAWSAALAMGEGGTTVGACSDQPPAALAVQPTQFTIQHSEKNTVRYITVTNLLATGSSGAFITSAEIPTQLRCLVIDSQYLDQGQQIANGAGEHVSISITYPTGGSPGGVSGDILLHLSDSAGLDVPHPVQSTVPIHITIQ